MVTTEQNTEQILVKKPVEHKTFSTCYIKHKR